MAGLCVVAAFRSVRCRSVPWNYLGLHCSKLEFSYSINAINIIVHAV